MKRRNFFGTIFAAPIALTLTEKKSPPRPLHLAADSLLAFQAEHLFDRDGYVSCSCTFRTRAGLMRIGQPVVVHYGFGEYDATFNSKITGVVRLIRSDGRHDYVEVAPRKEHIRG